MTAAPALFAEPSASLERPPLAPREPPPIAPAHTLAHAEMHAKGKKAVAEILAVILEERRAAIETAPGVRERVIARAFEAIGELEIEHANRAAELYRQLARDDAAGVLRATATSASTRRRSR